MARYSEPKQKRSIICKDGLFIVKTKDMCTYHRTFEDAIESYSLVYGMHPIAGDIRPQIKLVLPKIVVATPVSFDEALSAFENSTEIYRKSIELIEQIKEQRVKYKATLKEITKSLEVTFIDPWQIIDEEGVA